MTIVIQTPGIEMTRNLFGSMAGTPLAAEKFCERFAALGGSTSQSIQEALEALIDNPDWEGLAPMVDLDSGQEVQVPCSYVVAQCARQLISQADNRAFHLVRETELPVVQGYDLQRARTDALATPGARRPWEATAKLMSCPGSRKRVTDMVAQGRSPTPEQTFGLLASGGRLAQFIEVVNLVPLLGQLDHTMSPVLDQDRTSEIRILAPGGLKKLQGRLGLVAATYPHHPVIQVALQSLQVQLSR